MTEVEGRLLYWPAQSPDLNPIEHMWAYLKIQLGKYTSPPRSCKELWERISMERYKIPVELCSQLIRSKLKRLQAVHKVKGKHIKYWDSAISIKEKKRFIFFDVGAKLLQ